VKGRPLYTLAEVGRKKLKIDKWILPLAKFDRAFFDGDIITIINIMTE
jgi:hypothetical protein